MADGAPEQPPVPLKRGRGRPRKVPINPGDQEPPPKRRKYDAGTPDRSRVRHRVGRDGRTSTLGAMSPFDGDHEQSALKSEGHDGFHAEENAVSPRTIRARTESRPRRSYARTRSRGRPSAAPRPRYSSAAAAAAASQASDGYKPREERSWEEFHPDLDIEVSMAVYTADEVDGRVPQEHQPSGLRQETTEGDENVAGLGIAADDTDNAGLQRGEDILGTPPPVKRKPGRPPRRPESMLSGLGSPPAPRILPIPTHNPKERLNLPKPSYRHVQTFKTYEEDKKVQIEDYVDKAMAKLGYQESERFDLPPETLIRYTDAAYDDELGASLVLESDRLSGEQPPHQLGDVEYDMDEQDERWLEAHNTLRKAEGVDPIKPAIFEIVMTQLEREYYALEKRTPKPNPRHANTPRPRSGSAAAVNGEPWGAGDEPDSKCAICDDGDCENANAIIFCDGCDLAVHQECYGVPFIPEGQWFCRKCKEIGRGTPTCIFCPNVEGAFKQTNTLRWSHLLCAIWIPEVAIANLTYMEPVQDIEKVPRSRWGLVCYICDQRMGACIQCSNKACYQAFHVTCARRARLFLKMKATPTSGIDPSILRAFCDKHVSPDWRRDHDTDTAIYQAKRYYRKKMRNRKWADSQTAALALNTDEQMTTESAHDAENADDRNGLTAAGSKRKKKEPAKTGWRLPSGAPVVPAVVFNAVEQSLQRFMLRKRKDFAMESSKYWTLKREARRGAALLKRLQLQLETSSAMEVTRRNFVGMGAAGRPKLIRRTDFAELLQKEIVRLTALVNSVSEREYKKLEDVDNLHQLMSTVYFPITSLLWPILRKAQKLAEKSHLFDEGLAVLDHKLTEHAYTSVSAFSADIGSLFAKILASTDTNGIDEQQPQDISQIHDQIVPLSWSQRQALSAEQKHQKQVAKRIVRAIKEPLEAALHKELQLKGIPFEKEMQEWNKLDKRLESCLSVASLSEQNSMNHEPGLDGELAHRLRNNSHVSASVAGGASPSLSYTAPTPKIDPHRAAIAASKKNDPVQAPSPPISADSNSSVNAPNAENSMPAGETTPAVSNPQPLVTGGVPWYMRAFSPVGTTIYDEKWQRAVSEDLSEVDEATLNDMDIDFAPIQANGEHTTPLTNGTTHKSPAKAKSAKARNRHGRHNQAATPIGPGGRTTRSGSIAGSVNGSIVGTTRTSRSGRNSVAVVATPVNNRSSRKASLQVRGGALPNGDAESPDVLSVQSTNGGRSSRRSAAKAEIEVDGAREQDLEGGDEAEEERRERERREKYNAKRRAQRRKGF